MTTEDMQESHRSDHSNTHVSRDISTDPTQAEVNPLDLLHHQATDSVSMEECTRETNTGEIIKPIQSFITGKTEDWKLVTFRIDDTEDPKNWSKPFKWYCTMIVSFACFVVTFSSSVITADIEGPAKAFGVSREASTVVVTVFVIGFGVGPMAFAPLSEMVGRRVVYATTLLLAVIFIIPCAVAPNIGTLIVCRAIDGIAFSAPMTLVGGTLADLWDNEERAVPMAAFSASPFLGPAIGPLAGGFLADATNWKWLYWLQLILAFVAWILITFTVPETYAPTLLKKRAKKLRNLENDHGYVAEVELDPRTMGERLRVFLFRPFELLFLEPIVLFISLYMSVLYGLLYIFFVAYPVIYCSGKGWSASATGLMFIPLAIGVLMSASCAPFVNRHFLSICAKHGGKPPAEVRLIPMMLSCWFIPLGLFIFAWTSYPHIHWIGPAIGGWPVGFGIIFLYNSANNYLVDTYQHQAASALAAKTFLRSIWGASTVLFTEQMYDRLGYQWASTLLAFIALACCAIPYVFYFKGASIRGFSRHASSSDEEKVERDQLDTQCHW
ncbi:MFS multidrug transporter [Aspergillus sclerotioniger CBS 115572]|uniref:MFS multidrug transporter n=1 Tax=Aspergillus sclerotioniger CBS 115572 TaxID=1450535 RepID=A0A317W8G9_9EURO|nr:MFS multidrug transporter [Aspergillus sclerotioniger CBS 115572]PWY80420.1 MFS multidrug transporter [Aspergillus sclerotioniger CBS 115572]